MVLALCAIDSRCLYPQCCPLEYKEHYVPIDSLSKEGAIRLLGKDPSTILTKFFHSPKEPSRRGKAWDQAGTRGDVREASSASLNCTPWVLAYCTLVPALKHEANIYP